MEVPHENIDYFSMNQKELKAIAKERRLEGYSSLSKNELIKILQ